MEQKGKYAEMFHSQAKYYAGSTYGGRRKNMNKKSNFSVIVKRVSADL